MMVHMCVSFNDIWKSQIYKNNIHFPHIWCSKRKITLIISDYNNWVTLFFFHTWLSQAKKKSTLTFCRIKESIIYINGAPRSWLGCDMWFYHTLGLSLSSLRRRLSSDEERNDDKNTKHMSSSHIHTPNIPGRTK